MVIWFLGYTDFSAQVDSLADRLMMIRQDIRDGKLDPNKISLKVGDFRPEPLLGKVYNYHRQIQSTASKVYHTSITHYTRHQPSRAPSTDQT